MRLKNQDVQEVHEHSLVSHCLQGNISRTTFDILALQAVASAPGPIVRFPENLPKRAIKFWTWYTDQNGKRAVFLPSRDHQIRWPQWTRYKSAGASIAFTSGSVGSTFLRYLRLGAKFVRVFGNKDPAFILQAPARSVLAAVGAGMGASVTFLGEEHHPRFRGFAAQDIYFERSDTFLREWNTYAAPASLAYPIHTPKWECIETLHRLGDLEELAACRKYRDKKTWCGSCIECLYVAAVCDHKDIPIDIAISPKDAQTAYDEFTNFLQGKSRVDLSSWHTLAVHTDIDVHSWLKSMAQGSYPTE